VYGISWTDQQGVKEGNGSKYNMKDEKLNFFVATIPVSSDHPMLQKVTVEYQSTYPVLADYWVFSGNTNIARDNAPTISGQIGGPLTSSISGINQPVNRGICIALGFSTLTAGIGPGEILFTGAGAVFA